MSDTIAPVSTSQEIETKKVNINKLFTDFWFRVPEYQRSYKWGPEEIDDLLDDIQHAQCTAKEKEYFLGSVVLQKYLRSSGKLTYTCYDVLDGQQRLTTLLITMAVLRDLATDAKLKNRAAEAIFQEENQYENQPERIRIEYLIRDEVGDFVEKFLKPEGGTNQEDLLRQRSELPNVSVSNMAKASLYQRDWLSDLKPDELNRLAIFLFNAKESMRSDPRGELAGDPWRSFADRFAEIPVEPSRSTRCLRRSGVSIPHSFTSNHFIHAHSPSANTFQPVSLASNHNFPIPSSSKIPGFVPGAHLPPRPPRASLTHHCHQL
jgi:hypothetical protein